MLKKKLLFMLSSMNIGGVEKSLLSLLTVIPKDQYEVTVLLLHKGGGFLELIPHWVKVEEATWFHEINPLIMQSPRQTLKGYVMNKQYWKLTKFLTAYIISKYFNGRYFYYRSIMSQVPNHGSEYDLAVSYQGPTDIIDFYIANKVRAKRKISWVHFDVSKHLINSKLYSSLFEKYDKVFAISPESREQLIKKIPSIEDKVGVFFNIISRQVVEEMSQQSIDFDDDFKGLKILTVGRLSSEKGQDLAIKVLHKLKEEGYNVRWYCIGDGNSRKEYEALIEEHGLSEDFILLGSKMNPYPYVRKADLYVQTSRHEGYCITLAEARCLRKPVVTTGFIGAYNQIQDGHTGFIAECNEEDLFQKVKSLIQNPDVRERFCKNLADEELNTIGEEKKLFNEIH